MTSADVCCTRRDVHFCGGGRAQGVVGEGEGRVFKEECGTFHLDFLVAPTTWGSENDFLDSMGFLVLVLKS